MGGGGGGGGNLLKFRASRNTPSCFIVKKPEMSGGAVSNFALTRLDLSISVTLVDDLITCLTCFSIFFAM